MIIIQANGAEGDLEEKILALLRREDIAAERVSLSSRHTLTFPELTIDGRSQQAFQNGTALALTRIEFNMLLFLASNPGVTLSKEDLFSALLSSEVDVLSVHLHLERVGVDGHVAELYVVLAVLCVASHHAPRCV